MLVHQKMSRTQEAGSGNAHDPRMSTPGEPAVWQIGPIIDTIREYGQQWFGNVMSWGEEDLVRAIQKLSRG